MLGLPTPHWNHDFSVAVEVYNRTTFLSSHDMMGNPTLDKLEFVMETLNNEVSDKERFLQYIEAIHACKLNQIAQDRAANAN
jgi:hypothetical protein